MFEGIKFDLGEDTGLRHYYVDTDVENGQTYYYALVPYDRGLVATSSTGEISGISPSEASSVIRVSAAGVVEYVDINCAVITPRAPAAGYQEPHLAGSIEHEGPGTGRIEVELLDASALQDNATYETVFHDTSAFALNAQTAFDFSNTSTQVNLLESSQLVLGLSTTPVLEGMVLHVYGDTAAQVLEAETGWVKGNHNWNLSRRQKRQPRRAVCPLSGGFRAELL